MRLGIVNCENVVFDLPLRSPFTIFVAESATLRTQGLTEIKNEEKIMKKVTLGIDIGGTNTKYGFVDKDGKITGLF